MFYVFFSFFVFCAIFLWSDNHQYLFTCLFPILAHLHIFLRHDKPCRSMGRGSHPPSSVQSIFTPSQKDEKILQNPFISPNIWWASDALLLGIWNFGKFSILPNFLPNWRLYQCILNFYFFFSVKIKSKQKQLFIHQQLYPSALCCTWGFLNFENSYCRSMWCKNRLFPAGSIRRVWQTANRVPSELEKGISDLIRNRFWLSQMYFKI